MERGDSREFKEETKENKETKTEDTVDPPPPPARQAKADSDLDNNSIMSSATNMETDFLKYLEPEYRKFKAKPDLSDVITLERKLGTALWNIPNKYKVGGWSHVVDDDDTHKI